MTPKTTKVRNENAVDGLVWLDVAELEVFPEVQRELREAWVAYLVANWDPDKLGVIHVSRRRNGVLSVVDGQHRVAMLRAVFPDQHFKIECKVYEGLSVAEEAELFRALNNFLRPTRLQDYLKGVVAKDPTITAINQIVEAAHFKVGPATGPHTIMAVGALQAVYFGFTFHVRRKKVADSGAKPFPDLLRLVLNTINEAWGGVTESCHGAIIEGLGRVLVARFKALNMSELVHSLASTPGGPAALVGMGRGRAAIMGTTLALGVADVMLTHYNKRRGVGRVELLK